MRAAIAEPVRANGRAVGDVDALAELAMLTPELLTRRPHEVSDGQLQRARLAPRPGFVVCDEMTTMLDASTTAKLAGVIREYQRETGAGVPAISHDMLLPDRWADRTVRLEGLTAPA